MERLISKPHSCPFTVPRLVYHFMIRSRLLIGTRTIFFTCEPAWPCFANGVDISSLWETDMYTDTMAIVDRKTGLLLEY